MDQRYVRLVDHIALQGTPTCLQSAYVHLFSDTPRPAQLRFLSAQFSSRPHLFTSPDWNAPVHELEIIACDALCRRALGYDTLEHPPLPQHAWNILRHIGRTAASGALQAELAKVTNLSPVMVSHYLGALSARRLVARKKVVLTTTKTGEGSRNLTNITYTSVIVLARFAAQIGQADPKLGEEPHGPEKKIADLNVERCVQRVLEALKVPPHVRTQRDLKVVAMPEEERPEGFSREVYQRRRHRAFRAVKVRLQRMGVVDVVERKCVNVEGKARGVLTCLKLVTAKKVEDEAVVVKVDHEDTGEEERVKERSKGVMDREEGMEIAVDKVPDLNGAVQGREGAVEGPEIHAHFLKEVDVVEQVYQLLRRAGSRGMSVPEITTYLDGGSGLTNTPQKRVRNIINGIKRVVPVVESQRFEGSAMHLKICLAEFSDMNGVLPSVPKTAVAQMSQPGSETPPTRDRKSQLARKKNELTSLGLQRQELIVKLLEERKAMVIETLGREIARLENSGLERVDQKVMRRIINGLVAQQRANIVTTAKPSIKESNRWQTIRLVVLPHLDENCAEVAQAIAQMTARALYGDAEGSHTPKKRKAPECDEIVVTESVRCRYNPPEKMADTPKGSKARPPKAPKRRTRAVTKEEETKEDEPSPDVENVDAEPAGPKKLSLEDGAQSELERQPDGADEKKEEAVQKGSPKRRSTAKKRAVSRETETKAQPQKKSMDEALRDAVVLQSEIRDSRKSTIWRLRSIDCGLVKGRMARIRLFHEKLYKIVVQKKDSEAKESLPQVQHSTLEVAKDAMPLGTFTIFSCLKEFTVGEYSAIVGLYQHHGLIPESMREKKMMDVMEVMDKEMQSSAAARQIQGLVQALVRLNLMKSTMDAQWMLCGAGIIRDFGKGMPMGVIPHGIIFSSLRAVDVYWRELEQFAHYRYIKSAWKNPDKGDAQGAADDAWSQSLADVYMAARWKQVQQQSFVKKEQLEYETLLQYLSGVDVAIDESGNAVTSNFIVTKLKRFSVEELFDVVHGKSNKQLLKKPTQRSTPNAERLLFYSRFRSQNDIPKGLCGNTEIGEQTRSFDARGEHLKGKSVLLVTLFQGSAVVETSLRRSAGSPLKKPTPKRARDQNRQLQAQSAPLKKARPELEVITVDVEPCVELLRSVARRRAMSYCRNKREAPNWTVSLQLSSEKKDRQSGVSSKQIVASSGSESHEAAVKACQATLVQDVVELYALQFALELLRGNKNESEELLQAKCEKLERSRTNMDVVLRAAMIESHQESYRNKLQLQLTSCPQLASANARQRILSKEFGLDTNIRFRQGFSLGQQLAVLAERHRQLLVLQDDSKLVHGILFGTSNDCDESSEDTRDTTRLRTEVVEQVIASILQEGRLTAKSSAACHYLGKLCKRGLASARDRLLLQGAIRLRDGDSAKKHFVIHDIDRYFGNTFGRELEPQYFSSEKEQDWILQLTNFEDEDEEQQGQFKRTAIGKAAFGRDNEDSKRAMIASTQLAFFGKSPLNLKPIVIDRVGEEDDIDEDGEEKRDGKRDGRSRMTIDMDFSYIDMDEEGAKEDKTVTEAMEENDAERKLRREVENLVQSKKHAGMPLGELLESSVAKECNNKAMLAKAVYRMLETRAAYRFSIDARVATNESWTPDNGVLYLWHTYAQPLCLLNDPDGSVLNVWSSVTGQAKDALVDNVIRTILSLVRKNPGVPEWQVMREVERKFGSVPARAAADVVFLLTRHGALRRFALKGNGDGPFRDGQHLNLETKREWWRGFVDGETIIGVGKGYLQTCIGGRAVRASEIAHVGSRMWN